MEQFSLKRREHLKSQKTIDGLWAQNNALKNYPVKMVYGTAPSNAFAIEVGFVSPKKFHRHAVDRNRTKRQMHEAFRLNRNLLNQLQNQSIKLSMIFVAQTSEMLGSAEVNSKIKNLLERLVEKMQQTNA